MSTPPPIPPRPVEPLPYATPNLGKPGVLCPMCGAYAAKPMSFTWWGGVIGPKLLNHHKCDACKSTFNGKTGKSNTTGIVIYTVVILGIVIVVLAFQWSSQR